MRRTSVYYHNLRFVFGVLGEAVPSSWSVLRYPCSKLANAKFTCTAVELNAAHVGLEAYFQI